MRCHLYITRTSASIPEMMCHLCFHYLMPMTVVFPIVTVALWDMMNVRWLHARRHDEYHNNGIVPSWWYSADMLGLLPWQYYATRSIYTVSEMSWCGHCMINSFLVAYNIRRIQEDWRHCWLPAPQLSEAGEECSQAMAMSHPELELWFGSH